MMSATKHFRTRLSAARRAGFACLKVELLEHRLQPGSLLTESLGWSVFGDAFGVPDWDPTVGALSDASPDHAPVHRASRLEDASAGLFCSTSSLAVAPTGGHDELVGSPAQAATSKGIWPADDWLNQVAVTRAHLASAATQLAQVAALPQAGLIPATPVTEHSVTSFAVGEKGSTSPRKLAGPAQDVLQHHLNPTRDGLYVDALLTQKAAANTHRDPVETWTSPVRRAMPTVPCGKYIVSGSVVTASTCPTGSSNR
jgi:hypothetical protein